MTATHEGYFAGGFGQRVPLGHTAPIEVTRESTLFAEIRLRHKGAVTGRILDENGVGTAGVPVLAYRARLPLRTAGSAVSDDRGVFRIPGLEAGKYWVRSGGYALVDGTGWLATFGPMAREVREARVHQVTYDADTGDLSLWLRGHAPLRWRFCSELWYNKCIGHKEMAVTEFFFDNPVANLKRVCYSGRGRLLQVSREKIHRALAI